MLSIQSKRIEKTAKSTDEAINLALSELGATRDMVEIEILEEGAKGLFGILGGKDAKVAVTLKPTPASVARAFLDELFFSMGMKVDVAIDEGADALNISCVYETAVCIYKQIFCLTHMDMPPWF